MPNVYMLIGLPGSGKSTCANEIIKYNDNIKIFSSDEYREKLTGDVNNQTSNNKIFNILYSDLIEHVKLGGDAIYDATNISRKSRKEVIKRLNDLHISDLKIYAKVIILPIEECIKRNNNRERVVPEEVIYNMACKFELPLLNEGFSDIEYRYNCTVNDFYDPVEEFLKMRDFNQDNPNHSKNLDIHCFQSFMYLLDKTSNKNLQAAALFHDIGKVFVAKYNAEKGYTQYIGHENYGAYRCLTTKFPDYIIPVSVALYVNYHMELFKLNDAKENTIIKHKSLFKDGFWNNLKLLREADLNNH